MKSFFKIPVVGVFLFFFFCPRVEGQSDLPEEIDDSLRVKYILDFMQNLRWKDESAVDTFRIQLITRKDGLLKEFKKRDLPTLRGGTKPVKVFKTSSIDSLRPSEVIFMNKEEDFDIDLVYNRIKEEQTLLIGEHYPFYKSIATVWEAEDPNHPGKITTDFFLYKKKLFDNGFSVRPLFLDMVEMKTQDDWKEAFQQTEGELARQKEKVREQKKRLQNLKEAIQQKQEQIKKQEKRIQVTKTQLKQEKERLKSLKEEVDIQQRKLKARTKEIQAKKEELAKRKEKLKEQKETLAEQQATLKEQQENIKAQKARIEEQKDILGVQSRKIQQQNLILILFGVLGILLAVTAFLVYRGYRIKQSANKKLEEKNEAITEQRDQISEQNKEITQSIQYASRIQAGILPPTFLLNEILPPHYILYLPRDIVSGDYYWAARVDDKLVVTAADCTGHGVPGAMMSMLGVAYLKEIVVKQRILEAGPILDQLREQVVRSLNQGRGPDEEASKDGMDMALCVIDEQKQQLTYAGANNPLYLIRKSGEFETPPKMEHQGYALWEIKADKMPVGKGHEMDGHFQTHTVDYQKGDRIVMFSDGYADQFGGEKAKKMKYKPFKKLLLSLQEEPFTSQKEALNSYFYEWKGDLDQVDDVIVMQLEL